ncbi:MAG: M28 family metallopeptidase [Actinomycetes bacterium]
MKTVRTLAGRIGPREATSASFMRATDLVEREFSSLGYVVTRPSFQVPAGNSWGIDVPAGKTVNVVARPTTLERRDRYIIVGAHLDTVPQAPGAEDNASGVAVMLELARLAAGEPTGLPVIFVAFGAEEPRGIGEGWHHFGSKDYTSHLQPSDRHNLVAMVSLDRVGVGPAVPVCDGDETPSALVQDLRAAGRRANVPTTSCGMNRSSDHWSFQLVGLPAARLGSTAYAAYHSAQDVPRVVQRAQLKRTGDLAWEFLTSAS